MRKFYQVLFPIMAVLGLLQFQAQAVPPATLTGRSITFQKGLWVEPGPLNYPVLLLDNAGASTTIQPDATLSEMFRSAWDLP